LHGDGVMVVGDAGGFVNPLTGGGIYLGNGQRAMAARAACEALAAHTYDASFCSGTRTASNFRRSTPG
jgi:flavin-dependent dehydrogenase